MTDYKKYINALRKCAKEHDNDRIFTGHIIVSDLCRDTANLLEELEYKAESEIKMMNTDKCKKCNSTSLEKCLKIQCPYFMNIKKTNTHIVIKREDVFKYLTDNQIKYLDAILNVIADGRKKDGKKTDNSYYICNTDELYADEVLEVILKTESEENRQCIR